MQYMMELLQERYDNGDEQFRINRIVLEFENRDYRDMVEGFLKIKGDQVEMYTWEEGMGAGDCSVCLCTKCVHRGLCPCKNVTKTTCESFKNKEV